MWTSLEDVKNWVIGNWQYILIAVLIILVLYYASKSGFMDPGVTLTADASSYDYQTGTGWNTNGYPTLTPPGDVTNGAVLRARQHQIQSALEQAAMGGSMTPTSNAVVSAAASAPPAASAAPAKQSFGMGSFAPRQHAVGGPSPSQRVILGQ